MQAVPTHDTGGFFGKQTGIADSDPQAVFLNAGKALSPGLNPYPEQFQSF